MLRERPPFLPGAPSKNALRPGFPPQYLVNSDRCSYVRQTLICSGAMAYRKPALIELFAELHLDGSFPGGVFSVVHGLMSAGLPNLENIVSANQIPGVPSAKIEPRLRLWSDDRTKLVQLQENLIVVNHVGPYLGWDNYRSFIGQVLTVASGLHVSSISLNALDRFEFPAEGFTIGKYLNGKGRLVPEWFAESGEAADLIMGRGSVPVDGRNRQIQITVMPEQPGQPREVRIHTIFHQRMHATSVAATLNELHVEMNATFEGLITDATRAHMGGSVT